MDGSNGFYGKQFNIQENKMMACQWQQNIPPCLVPNIKA